MSAIYPREYVSWAGNQPSGAQRLRHATWASVYAASLIPYAIRYGVQRRIPHPPHPGATALDIGSATGVFLGRLRDKGWEVWGVEPGVEAGQASIALLGLDPDRVRLTTLEEADFPSETFDLVTMSHVLEHLHDPLAALKKVNTWLKPTGRLKLWCPNYDSLERRIFGRYWLGLDVPRHLYHFTPASLAALLATAGFVPLKVVPEPQTATLTGSVVLAFDALRGRRGSPGAARLLHYLLMPVGSLALAAGSGGSIAVASALARSDSLEDGR